MMERLLLGGELCVGSLKGFRSYPVWMDVVKGPNE